ncbi:PAS domain-containing protein [Tellurirhabdus bombi]|uniref:PAS domain-containing protein n=1 Tax=Tellurirhabdus bombi TaxID=2907205 RepID=UPI001F1749D0|nr:PAS domain-containing protein [Tellurirhabdus bombi]
MHDFSSQEVKVNKTLTELRSFPVACMEIFMLEQAQLRKAQQEARVLQQLASAFKWKVRRNYSEALKEGRTLVVTDAAKRILWTNHRFLTMTGYTIQEAIGQTPNFLQGIETDSTTVRRLSEKLRKSAKSPRAYSVQETLLNYRKNGEPYWCEIRIDPLVNHDGQLTHYMAVEREITNHLVAV